MKDVPDKNSNRLIGTHIRVEKNYSTTLEKALSTGSNCCQFFLFSQESDKYLRLSKKEVSSFLTLRENIKEVYGHCSYWINPSSGNPVSSKVSKNLLRKEIKISNKLNIKYLVTHAGNAKGFEAKADGIKAMAKIINKVLKKEDNVTLLVENTAHANKTVCSDLEDFKLLRSLIDPSIKNIGFCFDTSHAFSYGYDFENTEELVKIIDETMGIENIKLIHLNDSKRKCGSKLDEHELPGKGLIGKKNLQKFINHKKIAHIPLIIEPPLVKMDEMSEVIEEIKSW